MKTETQSFYAAAVERALRRITRSLDDAIDHTSLAQEAALSPFHFHRVFRGMVGETPLEMHRRLRLERAASLLLGTEVAVTTLAFDAGYESHEAFTRAFRQAFGESPTLFRESGHDARRAGNRLPQVTLPARSGVHFDPLAAGHAPPNVRFLKGEIPMNVTLEDLPALRVAAVRHVGPYNRIAEAFARLGEVAGPAGLVVDGAMMLALYHDDP